MKLGGRYEILEKLGEGSYGITYLACDLHSPSNSLCVLKALSHQNPKILALFNREARTLEKLGKHSHIPELRAYFDEGDHFYIAQELIEGHNLTKEIYAGRQLSEGYVRKLLLDVLGVLAFVHQHRVIHRDIKPANLIRRKTDGDIFLIDFGSVKELSVSEVDQRGRISTTVPVGTNGYMAPEQMRGQPGLSSDLFSVGMLAIVALTGVVPHQLGRDRSTQKVNWPIPENLSPELTGFINRLVEPHPKRRYANAQKALEDLKRMLAHQKIAKDSSLPTVRAAPVGVMPPPPEGETLVKTLRPLSNQRMMQVLGYTILALVFMGVFVKGYEWSYDFFKSRTLAQNQVTHQNLEAPPEALANLLEDGSLKTRPGVVEAFWAMAMAAQDEGVSLYPITGYVSLADQREQLTSRGVESVEKWLAKTDYHTGYAIDIADYSVDRNTDRHPRFAQTPAFKWLNQNAKTYGFELSYPQGNPAGEKEPWHWRYVGDGGSDGGSSSD